MTKTSGPKKKPEAPTKGGTNQKVQTAPTEANSPGVKTPERAMVALAAVAALEPGQRGRKDAKTWLKARLEQQLGHEDWAKDVAHHDLNTPDLAAKAVGAELLHHAPEFEKPLQESFYGHSWNHNPKHPDIIAFRKELLKVCPAMDGCSGRYIKLIELPDKTLVAVATEEFEEDANDYRAKLEKRTSNDILCELMEDYLGNGWETTVDDDRFGITQERIQTPNGETLAVGRNYFDKEYVTEAPVESLLNHGWFVFTTGAEDDDYEPCCLAKDDADNVIEELVEKHGITLTFDIACQALYHFLKGIAKGQGLPTPLAVSQNVGLAYMGALSSGTQDFHVIPCESNDANRWHDQIVKIARREANHLLVGGIQTPLGPVTEMTPLTAGVVRLQAPSSTGVGNVTFFKLDDEAEQRLLDAARVEGGWHMTFETIQPMVSALPYLFTSEERKPYGSEQTHW